jgi:hypothetical protein
MISDADDTQVLSYSRVVRTVNMKGVMKAAQGPGARASAGSIRLTFLCAQVIQAIQAQSRVFN